MNHNKFTFLAYIVSLIAIIFCMVQCGKSKDYVTRDEVHEIVDSILIEIYD